MKFFDTKISELIESQFPAIYRDEGEAFVAFVKAYYEWLEEQGNALFYSRKLLEYRDIDSTIDSFLGHFKYKYLNSIQFDTAADTASLVKHSLDLYRSKGTERSIDLFFKSVFGVPAEVYFPARDIFRTSSGVWIEPKYLEIEAFDESMDFVGLQIEGVDSGAKAFVEKYVKKVSTAGHVSHVFFISSIIGFFSTGEKIKSSVSGKIGPTVIGSMNYLTVTSGGSDYSVGDIVTVQSDSSGRNGKARVASVQSISGKVDFSLIDGGWGYNGNSQVLIAEKMMVVSGMYNPNSSPDFVRFETVVQPTCNLHYTGLSGLQFKAGDVVFKSNATQVIAQATVLDIDVVSSTEGYLLLSTALDKFDSTYSAVLEDGSSFTDEIGYEIVFESSETIANDGKIRVYSLPTDDNGDGLYYNDSANLMLATANTVANVASMVSVTASANLMKTSSNVTLSVVDSFTPYSAGDQLFQYSSYETANGYIDRVTYVGSNASIRLVNVNGTFASGNVYSRSTNASANAISISKTIGLHNVVGDFYQSSLAPIRGLGSQTSAYITILSRGSGASLTTSNTFLYEETVTRNTDILFDYLDVELDSSDYGFPSPGSTTLSSTLSDTLSYVSDDYGKISSIVVTNSGTDYNFSPYVMVFTPELYKYMKRDFIVSVSNTVGSFVVGEAVMQNGSVVGTLRPQSNSSVLYLKRSTFGDIVVNSPISTESLEDLTNETSDVLVEEAVTPLVGVVSGSFAYPTSIAEDPSSEPIGINAEIVASTTTAEGSVLTLDVVDSGFSYYDGEDVSFSMEDNANEGTATVSLRTYGTGTGYHRENNSLLSSTKYLQDGVYYQEFSYEVKSAITLDKYSDMLKQIMHVAGTELFAKFVHKNNLDLSVGITQSSLTIS